MSFDLGATFYSAQSLLLDLCSEITPKGDPGTSCGARDEIGTGHMQNSVLNPCTDALNIYWIKSVGNFIYNPWVSFSFSLFSSLQILYIHYGPCKLCSDIQGHS